MDFRCIPDVLPAALGHFDGDCLAVGLFAGRAAGLDSAIPRISLATAHPAKFPDAVEKATGTRPSMPLALADLFHRRERFTTLPNDLDQLRRLIRDRVSP